MKNYENHKGKLLYMSRQPVAIQLVPDMHILGVERSHTVYPVTPNAGMFYQRGYKQLENIRRIKM